mmetsp:Transcript_11378/g.10199  ORF Transcript_11378/g.10199 Transcript_11378/m.10199 type:complete len:350 (+) Transcript_11378:67-1116(+)
MNTKNGHGASSSSDEDELELAPSNHNNTKHKADIKHASHHAKYQQIPSSQSNPIAPFDSVDPLNIVKTAIKIGYKKAQSTSLSSFGGGRIIMKAMMSGAYLGFTITLSLYARSLGWDAVAAGLLFPMGFVMLILMGNDLATGNFALLPMAYLDGLRKDKGRGKGNKQSTNEYRVSIMDILVNWFVVYIGNFLGALLFLFLVWGGMTHFGGRDESKYSDYKDVLCLVTESKTLGYKSTGGAQGWFAALFNGILCNWMVTMGVLLAFSSKSTIGRIFAMYIPITIFITLGFEHSIVNLYLLPAGLSYECDTYNASEWWIWNQIPVTLGNIIGGICLTGLWYYFIWSPKLSL